MMAQQPKNRGEAGQFKSAGGLSENPPVTLDQAGIDKNLAHRARTLAAMSGNDFTVFVDEGREQVQRSVERAVMPTDADEQADPPTQLKAPPPPLSASQQQIITQIVKMFDEDLEQDGRKELMGVLTAKYRELYG